MALVKCKECGEQISTQASKCPKCGARRARSLRGAEAVGAILIAGGALWFYAGGGWQQVADQQMGDITNKVAQDAVAQYNIAKQQGDPMQICVQAGFVAAAYLQAKDQGSYNNWKATEKGDCARAEAAQ